MMKFSLILTVAILHCVYFASAKQRCDAPGFSCQFNDPCDPLCVADQYVYPGSGARVYVECVDGACAEQQCPRRTTWNQANQRCEGGNGLEARCSFGKFDCEERNPCAPTLCEAGVENYPGPSPRRYVNCTEGCVEAQCPRRKVWDQEEQRCVRKPIVCPEGQTFDEATQQCVETGGPVVCSWQEITVATPAADCTNEFTFLRTRYRKEGESGNRHLDGFVDCEAASEGNQYYVEDFDLSEEPQNTQILYSCFKPDGLCLTLTSPPYEGSWYNYVFNLAGPSVQGATLNEAASDLDHAVSSECVEMDYFDEPATYVSLTGTPWYADCYNKGGRLLFLRTMSNFGSCSAKIPCGITTTESVKIHEYVCA